MGQFMFTLPGHSGRVRGNDVSGGWHVRVASDIQTWEQSALNCALTLSLWSIGSEQVEKSKLRQYSHFAVHNFPCQTETWHFISHVIVIGQILF